MQVTQNQREVTKLFCLLLKAFLSQEDTGKAYKYCIRRVQIKSEKQNGVQQWRVLMLWIGRKIRSL